MPASRNSIREMVKPQATDVVNQCYKDYVTGMEVLQKPYVFFNDRAPLTYWADGRLRFNVYVPQRRKNTKEWRTLYRSAITRNKCLGVIAHLIGMTIAPSIQAQNEEQEEDIVATQFFRDVVEYSQEKENFGIKLFWAVVTAVAEGTVILEDNYGRISRMVKEITDWDEKTGKMKWTEKDFDEFSGAFTNLVPNDELLIPDPFISDIQKQDWIIRCCRMTYDQAQARYGHYASWNNVKPGVFTGWIYSSDYFQPYSSVSYLTQNQVEVITRYCKATDTMDIVVNGVQLTEDGNPNPRQDKQYPFAKSGYEPIDYSFFWYKALTDKNAPEQDVYDAMMRMVIDRQHLRNIPPYATNNPALVNEEIIIPGNVVYTGTVEKPFMEAIGPASDSSDAGTGNLLQAMRQNMDQNSIDPMQTGNAPTGGVPTATQAIQMAQNAKVMLGLFGHMIGMLISDWTKLRMQTIIWRMSQEEDMKKITLSDRILASGKVGKRSYVFEDGLSTQQQNYKMDLSKQIAALEGKSDGKLEIVALDPEELSKLSLYVKIDSQLKPRRTDALMQAIALDKWAVYSSRPDIFNVNAAAIALTNAWGDDPDNMIISKQTQSEPTMQAGSEMPEEPVQQSALGMAPPTPTMSAVGAGVKTKLGIPKRGDIGMQPMAI